MPVHNKLKTEEKAQLEALFRTYSSFMFFVAQGILKDSDDAEDAVQQAFLSMLPYLSRIDQIDSPRTKSFVAIVTRNKALDCLRRKAKHPVQSLDEMEESCAVAPPPGDHDLADAMARLPAQMRDILLLRFDNGYSTAEIADLLDLKRNTVQKKIRQARKTLKQYLDEG